MQYDSHQDLKRFPLRSQVARLWVDKLFWESPKILRGKTCSKARSKGTLGEVPMARPAFWFSLEENKS